MDILSGDISAMVFRRMLREDLGEVSLDGQTLNVLMELDGRKSLFLIAKKLGLTMGTMRGVIAKCLQQRLIEPVESAVAILDKDFLDYLRARLSVATGPIAEVLIEDAVNDLGHGMLRFPSHRAAELVDLLARQIQREEKRTIFKQNMIKKINEKGYNVAG